jgi:hypothetical protein
VSDPIDRSMETAARTLRDATREPGEASAMTRARILASHRAARTRTERASTWLMAAAALLIVLGGSTAWAYWTGRLDRLIPDARPAETQVEAPSAPPRAPSRPAPRVEPTEPAEILVPSAPTTPIVTDDAVDHAPVVSPIIVDPSVAPAEPSETIVDPAERRAYREAHALHFEQHDDAEAIAAWDRYLASYPHGRFALEARYNRALCLVRSGREVEAREALAPFVLGTHGGYRQSEATEIVDALDAP